MSLVGQNRGCRQRLSTAGLPSTAEEPSRMRRDFPSPRNARAHEAVSRIAMADAKQGWPADHVERWPIDRLIPFAKNSRTHTPAQIAQLAASMRESVHAISARTREACSTIAMT